MTKVILVTMFACLKFELKFKQSQQLIIATYFINFY